MTPQNNWEESVRRGTADFFVYNELGMGINTEKFISFIRSVEEKAREEERNRIIEKVRVMPVVFLNEDYNHEYVDTCDIYKALQSLNK